MSWAAKLKQGKTSKSISPKNVRTRKIRTKQDVYDDVDEELKEYEIQDTEVDETLLEDIENIKKNCTEQSPWLMDKARFFDLYDFIISHTHSSDDIAAGSFSDR